MMTSFPGFQLIGVGAQRLEVAGRVQEDTTTIQSDEDSR